MGDCGNNTFGLIITFDYMVKKSLYDMKFSTFSGQPGHQKDLLKIQNLN